MKTVILPGNVVKKDDRATGNRTGHPMGRDLLKLYAAEIRKIPLLSPQEEGYWARLYAEGRDEKKRLLKGVIEQFWNIPYLKPGGQSFLCMSGFPLEVNNLRKSFLLCSKIMQISEHLARSCPNREKRKLARERFKLKAEFSEALIKVTIKNFADWQILLGQRRFFTSKMLPSKHYQHELHTVRRRLAKIEPQIQESRQKLIQSNLRLVISICHTYRYRNVYYGDLIQEGNLGLIKAVEKFDYRKGFKLATYASWWIRSKISRAIEDKSRLIHIPIYLNEKFYKIKWAEKKMIAEETTAVTLNEIAGKLNLAPGEVGGIITAFKEPISLDSCLDDGESCGKILSDSRPGPLENLYNKKIKEEIGTLMASLSSRESSIIKLRFGLEDEEEKSLEEIGIQFHVSRERVRQIENNVLRKLRKKINHLLLSPL